MGMHPAARAVEMRGARVFELCNRLFFLRFCRVVEAFCQLGDGVAVYR